MIDKHTPHKKEFITKYNKLPKKRKRELHRGDWTCKSRNTSLFEKKQNRTPHDAIERPFYWLAFKRFEMPKESESEMTLTLVWLNALRLYTKGSSRSGLLKVTKQVVTAQTTIQCFVIYGKGPRFPLFVLVSKIYSSKSPSCSLTDSLLIHFVEKNKNW